MTFAPIAYDVSHRGSISVGLVEVPKPEAMRVRGGMWFQAGPVGLHLGIEPDMRPSVKALTLSGDGRAPAVTAPTATSRSCRPPMARRTSGRSIALTARLPHASYDYYPITARP